MVNTKENQSLIGKEIYTPLGKGKITFKLKNGSFVIEFEFGGGQIYTARELYSLYKISEQASLAR